MLLKASIILIAIGYCLGDDVITNNARTDATPVGPYYCQARCIASCLESKLASTTDDCSNFCPPFQEESPCPTDDPQCWKTCGIPSEVIDQPAPDAVSIVPMVPSDDEVQDPFLIQLTWAASENASLYIVEFYPLNRQPRPGEDNFFRTMTTSLTYSVRKEDECVMYDARVIAVNSFGISVPSYTLIEAPTPQLQAKEDIFSVRDVRKDQSDNLIYVTIDYKLPNSWPANDIDLGDISLRAAECNAPSESFASALSDDGFLNQSMYNVVIGKEPTTAVVMMVPAEAMQSDCLFQMRVKSWTSRCNTTVVFEDFDDAPGVDFRLNCDTVRGGCESNVSPDPDAGSPEVEIAPSTDDPAPANAENAPPQFEIVLPDALAESSDANTPTPDVEIAPPAIAPIPVPNTSETSPVEIEIPLTDAQAAAGETAGPDVETLPPGVEIAPPAIAPIPVPTDETATDIVSPINIPGHIPPSVDTPDEDIAFIEGAAASGDSETMPTPPPLPLFVIDADKAANIAEANANVAPEISLTIVDITENETTIQNINIGPTTLTQPMCELEMIDVQSLPNPASSSLIDLTVMWLERQSLPPLPPPTYFTIRYGPIVRQLIDDDRQQVDIVPGYETFQRTGQPVTADKSLPDPTRQVTISGQQRNSLLKIQICAIYDASTEPMIQWDNVRSRRIDLAALEPFLELENAAPMAPQDIQTSSAIDIDTPPIQQPQSVNLQKPEVPFVIHFGMDHDNKLVMHWATMMAALALLMVTACLVFACLRHACKTHHRVGKKPIYIVNSQQPPSVATVKVPMA